MADVETGLGNFSEEEWRKVIESGVAAGLPTGVPTAADLATIDTSTSGADWSGVLNTGIKTVADIVETGIDKGKQPAGTPPSKTPTPTPVPQINVTLPQSAPPAATAAGSSTALVVGGVVVGGLLLFVAASSLRKGRR